MSAVQAIANKKPSGFVLKKKKSSQWSSTCDKEDLEEC